MTREAVELIVAQAEAITAAEQALLDLRARIAALEAERDRLIADRDAHKRWLTAEETNLRLAVADLQRLVAERDAARAEAGLLRQLLQLVRALPDDPTRRAGWRAELFQRIDAVLAGSGEQRS